MSKIKKKYIIVGDNNYWYGTTASMSEKQAMTIFKRIKKEIKNEMYEDNGANEIYLYEVEEVSRLEV